MDGDKVGQNERAQHLFPALFQFARVHDDGNAGGDALVAAARNDDDGHLAPVHARIRSRRGVSARFHANVLRSRLQQNLSDVGAVIVFHALFRDGHVQLCLLAHKLFHVRKIDAVRKFANLFHAEKAAVGGDLFFRSSNIIPTAFCRPSLPARCWYDIRRCARAKYGHALAAARRCQRCTAYPRGEWRRASFREICSVPAPARR